MDKNIPLMLDSSILKQVPKLNSELFKELVKYIRADIYKLYISEIVEQEYISWIKAGAQDAFDTVTKTTKSLTKYYEEPSILGFNLELNTTVFVAEAQINGILKKVVDNWLEFKIKTNATVLPIEEHHGKLVMDAYFKGEKPFSKVKNRSDIPDAFIYSSLKGLLEYNEKVIFVSSDKKFSQSIRGERIVCFESLSDLFSKGPLKLDSRFFKSLDGKNRIFTLIKIYEDEIYKKLACEIELSELIEATGESFMGFAIGECDTVLAKAGSLIMHTDEIRNISESSFLIPFSARVKWSIESLATRDQLSVLSDYRQKNIEKEVNDNGDFKVSEAHYCPVAGHFSLRFDGTDPSTWKEQKKSDHIWSEYQIKEISVALEDVRAAV